MAQNKKRPGHPYQKPASIPAAQRAKGRVLWMILFAVFGMVMAYFASGRNYIALIIGGVVGALLGYMIGKKMELAAKK